MRAVLLYTVLRLAAFAATAAILFALVALLGLDIPPLAVVAVAAFLSGVLSWWLLARPRAAMAAKVAATTQRVGSKFDAGASSEDEPADPVRR